MYSKLATYTNLNIWLNTFSDKTLKFQAEIFTVISNHCIPEISLAHTSLNSNHVPF